MRAQEALRAFSEGLSAQYMEESDRLRAEVEVTP